MLYKSMGTTSLPVETPFGVSNICIKQNGFNGDVPALLGLDVLDSHFLLIDTVSKKPVKESVCSNRKSTFFYLRKNGVYH